MHSDWNEVKENDLEDYFSGKEDFAVCVELPTATDWHGYDLAKQRIRDIYPQPEAEEKVKQLIELLKL